MSHTKAELLHAAARAATAHRPGRDRRRRSSTTRSSHIGRSGTTSPTTRSRRHRSAPPGCRCAPTSRPPLGRAPRLDEHAADRRRPRQASPRVGVPGAGGAGTRPALRRHPRRRSHVGAVGPRHRTVPGRLRRDGRARRVLAPHGRRTDRAAVPARRPRERERRGVPQHERRQDRRVDQPRVPGGPRRPRRPDLVGGRADRVVLATSPVGARARLRATRCRPPRPRDDVELPVRSGGPAVRVRRVREHGRGGRRLPRADRVARPGTRRTVQRLHRLRLASPRRSPPDRRARRAPTHRSRPLPRLRPGGSCAALPHAGPAGSRA